VGKLNGKLQDNPFHEILVWKNNGAAAATEQPTADALKAEPQPDDPLSADLLSPMLLWTRGCDDTKSHRQDTSQSFSSSVFYPLVDSSTPTGGFAHSNTIEAAWQFQFLHNSSSLIEYAWGVMMQTITTTIPFVVGSCQIFLSDSQQDDNDTVQEWNRMDQWLSANMTSHVTRRASLVQGSGMLRAYGHCYPHISAKLKQLNRSAAKSHQGGHAATCFGATCGLLETPPSQAASMFLYSTARDMISAAVRMNLVGPHEGSRLIHSLLLRTDDLHKSNGGFLTSCNWEEAHQISPIVEVMANAHDRLYTRLFNS